MPWIMIIGLIVQFLGPLIADWMKRRLEDRLRRAAESLPRDGAYSSAAEAVGALFDRALADAPLAHVGERRLLHAARRAALQRAEEICGAAGRLAPLEGFDVCELELAAREMVHEDAAGAGD